MTTTDDSPPPLDGRRHALFLAIDGGLIELDPQAGTVRLRSGGHMLLERAAMALDGALGLLSGRQLAPEGDAAGPVPPDMDTARRRLHERILPGGPLRLDDESGALTIRFRDAPEEAERAGEIAREATAGLDGLEIVPGDTAFAIRPHGASSALPVLLAAPPFKGRAPVFVGDTPRDEHGFRAAAACRGFGVKVGPGETEARYRLADAAALHRWLARLGERA